VRVVSAATGASRIAQVVLGVAEPPRCGEGAERAMAEQLPPHEDVEQQGTCRQRLRELPLVAGDRARLVDDVGASELVMPTLPSLVH